LVTYQYAIGTDLGRERLVGQAIFDKLLIIRHKPKHLTLSSQIE